MNQIKNIAKLNEQELAHNVPISASWHQDFSDTAYVFFSGLPYELTEGDVLVIFSQYGIPVHLKLVRDRETGKSKGFGWLKYEDQRSTVLAVDNLNGTKVLGRMMRVDHAYYEEKERDDEYEVMLEEELKNDFAKAGEKEQEQEAPLNKDDEFTDPLLLMQTSRDDGSDKTERPRHRDEKDRERHRHRDDKHRHSSSHKSSSHRPHRSEKSEKSEKYIATIGSEGSNQREKNESTTDVQ